MTKSIGKISQRVFALMMALLMVLLSVPTNAMITQVTAATTNSDGYVEVRTIEDLYNIRNDLTAKYILMNDIDLTSATGILMVVDGTLSAVMTFIARVHSVEFLKETVTKLLV